MIGTGPVGLELAQAMARLGVAVTLFGQDDGLGALKDLEVKAELRKILEQDLTLLLDVEVDARREGEGVRLSWSGAASGEGAFDYVLVAAGRPPRLKGLGLESTGIELDDHGTPVYDPETLQCGASSIFIAAMPTTTGRSSMRPPTRAPSPGTMPPAIPRSDPPPGRRCFR